MNLRTALALEFLILTATRTSETLGARWQEFDLEAATWSIPAPRMKAGRDHSVPLSERAVEIVREARRRARKEPQPDSFVFFGTRPKKPVSLMAMPMLLRRMKIDATVHGFRASARSWMADQGVAFELAEACLAHQVGNAVVQAYQRSSMLERRRPVLAAWSDYVTGKTDGNVVPIKAARRDQGRDQRRAPRTGRLLLANAVWARTARPDHRRCVRQRRRPRTRCRREVSASRCIGARRTRRARNRPISGR